MLEPAIADGANQFGLEEKIAEASRMDTDVAALLVDIRAGGELALLAIRGGGCLVAANLLVGVVDEIFFVRHVERSCIPSGMRQDWINWNEFEEGKKKKKTGRWLRNATTAMSSQRPKVRSDRGGVS